jgi:hypothetical protein
VSACAKCFVIIGILSKLAKTISDENYNQTFAQSACVHCMPDIYFHRMFGGQKHPAPKENASG